MNDMRKLMEAVKLDEADDWWTNDDINAKFAEVMKFFSNKKHGGRIKPGYKAYADIDGEKYEIDTINILRSRGERPRIGVSGPWQGGYSVTMRTISEMEIYKLEKIL